MDFAPDRKQALVLWKLLFTGEHPALSKVRPKLEPGPRQALVDAGLVVLERRGRSQHLVPTEAAWDWAPQHLDAKLSRSPEAAPVLEALLARLKIHLARQGLALGELFVGGSDPRLAASSPLVMGPALADQIRDAYLSESGGALNVRVRLAALRRRLGDAPRPEVDAVLRTMQNAGELVLMTLDNPGERHPADDAAAVDVVGEKRHIAYLVR